MVVRFSLEAVGASWEGKQAIRSCFSTHTTQCPIPSIRIFLHLRLQHAYPGFIQLVNSG